MPSTQDLYARLEEIFNQLKNPALDTKHREELAIEGLAIAEQLEQTNAKTHLQQHLKSSVTEETTRRPTR